MNEVSGVTLVCALAVEERAAARGGARAFRAGLGAPRLPAEGPLVSFGLCGALVPGLEPGALLTAARVVDADGETVWEGGPLPVPGALSATICGAETVVDDRLERGVLAERTGAVAVDTESGALARSGRLVGAVRAVSDGPARPVGCLACAADPDGNTDWAVVARAVVTEPVKTARTALGATRALATLRQASAALANGAGRG